MSQTPERPEAEQSIDLKDPALAAFLAWLIPGLGHLYQGRYAKAVLFFVCILGTFAYGLYLGGNSSLGWGRVVYFSWGQEKRLPYLCQVGAGLPAMPALVQANRMSNGRKVWWNGFMAPPRPDNAIDADPNHDQPTANELHLKLHRYFELGTVYTMIAGLLNILAIYDAWGGPVFTEVATKEDSEEKQEEDESSDEKPSPESV